MPAPPTQLIGTMAMMIERAGHAPQGQLVDEVLPRGVRPEPGRELDRLVRRREDERRRAVEAGLERLGLPEAKAAPADPAIGPAADRDALLVELDVALEPGEHGDQGQPGQRNREDRRERAGRGLAGLEREQSLREEQLREEDDRAGADDPALGHGRIDGRDVELELRLDLVPAHDARATEQRMRGAEV